MTAIALLANGRRLPSAPSKQERAPEKSYVLADGTVHETPGEMFQYLRTRDNGLAAGNPSNIVDAYPGEAKNVGDMVRQKRVTE